MKAKTRSTSTLIIVLALCAPHLVGCGGEEPFEAGQTGDPQLNTAEGALTCSDPTGICRTYDHDPEARVIRVLDSGQETGTVSYSPVNRELEVKLASSPNLIVLFALNATNQLEASANGKPLGVFSVGTFPKNPKLAQVLQHAKLVVDAFQNVSPPTGTAGAVDEATRGFWDWVIGIVVEIIIEVIDKYWCDIFPFWC